jgi:hypothetical protein
MKTESPPAIRVALYAAAIVIAIGVLPLPYGFYGFLRIIAVLAFAYSAYVAFRTRSWVTLLVAVLALIVFNPVVPLRLPKDLWACIDAASAAYLAILAKHVQTQFATFGSPELTVEAVVKTLGFSVLLALSALQFLQQSSSSRSGGSAWKFRASSSIQSLTGRHQPSPLQCLPAMAITPVSARSRRARSNPSFRLRICRTYKLNPPLKQEKQPGALP